MSETASGAGRREVAYRMFAAEFDDADYSYSESDEDRAPNYVITPTGARANRLFIVGVLTETEQVSDDVLRARVVDPTGAFVLYAGQYQPDEQAFLERAEPPMFVAVTGKARTFVPDDSEQVFTSIRPESISEVDSETRDRWILQAAEQTLYRLRWMTTALTLDTDRIRTELASRGVDDGLAHGIELALEHYGTTPAYLDAVRETALDTLRVVAGEQDEIKERTTTPDASGGLTTAALLQRLPELAQRDTQRADDTAVDSPAVEADTDTEATAAESDSTAVADSNPTTQTDSTDTAASTDSHATEQSEPSTTEETAPEPGQESGFESDQESRSEPDLTADDTSEGLDDFEPGEFELEDETRAEIEAEFGTDFQTGTEVDEPGNADIDTPEPEEIETRPAETDSAAIGESNAVTGRDDEAETVDDRGERAGDVEEQEHADDENDAGGDGVSDETAIEQDDQREADDDEIEEPAEIQTAVVELMGELDDGDGADREELIQEMNARYGANPETVEGAIQSALMDGQCYEPDDSSIKPI